MRPSEALLRGLVAAGPEALLALDARGTVVFASDRVEHLFGWTPEELVGRPLERLLADDPSSGSSTFRAGSVGDTTGGRVGTTVSARRRDGTQFPAEVTLGRTVDDGDPCVLVAIRALPATEDREGDHDAQLTKVTDEVVHDLNNLFGVILNYASLLARRTDDSAVLTGLSEIRTAAGDAVALTRQLPRVVRDVVAPVPPAQRGPGPQEVVDA